MLEGRAARLTKGMPAGFEAALIDSAVNRFYLLDFDAHDAGALLVMPKEMVYLIDSRYSEAARAQVKGARVVLEEDRLPQLAALLKQAGVRRLYIEDSTPVAGLRLLRGAFHGVEIVDDNTLCNALQALRQIKDDEELARMKKAQAITDACFTHILPYIKPGVRELDLALEMDFFMRKNGAEGIAFDTICVAGEKTSLPHGQPGENRVQPGDFITMDFGARYRGYCSDMTRTVALGEPGEEKRRVYATVLKAHLAGIEAARAGQKGSDVDKAAREIINAAGYEGRFGHGLGHAVGIEVHEAPRFSPRCQDEVKAGMLLSVEPGVYLPGQFGCRIEDVVLIEEGGCTPLPASPKELLVL